jgi:uncharacterized protein
MRDVSRPVLVMHGDHDSVIPYRLGQRLFRGLDEPKRFATIAGREHNDPMPPDQKAYWEAVDRFLDSLPFR